MTISLCERAKAMILVDTSVLIDFFKGQKNNSCWKFELILRQDIPFGINSFIFQEVLQGAKSIKEYTTLKKYLETQRFYHLNDPVDSFARPPAFILIAKNRALPFGAPSIALLPRPL